MLIPIVSDSILPKTGSTALAKSEDLREWDIGRIRTQADTIAQWFQGWIDEVRISDVALAPSEFLFARP